MAVKSIKPVTISFKNTPEDIELHQWITSHSNLSGFVKDLLRSAMNGKEVARKVEVKESKPDAGLLDLGDF